MFILTPIEDTLRIAPQLFARRLEDVRCPPTAAPRAPESPSARRSSGMRLTPSTATGSAAPDAQPWRARASLRRVSLRQVIPDVGLGVALYDLLEVVKQQVFPGDGAAHVTGALRRQSGDVAALSHASRSRVSPGRLPAL